METSVDLRDEPDKIENWKRISVLGEGSFGVVTLWKNIDTGELLAIKKCRLTDVSKITQRQKERWQSEVELMKEVHNPNIVHFKPLPAVLDDVLSRFNPSGLPILSMEYCTRGNLRHVLCEPRNCCGLPEEDVRYILTDINSAVSFLHQQNVVHRDIKPENIVLQHFDNHPTRVIYKIIDLGYAKEMINSQVSFVGTLNYLAPEIFRCEKYNNSVDYWSMGILFHEVICGVIPFLPEKSPIERFEYIQRKHPDHICIYTSNDKINYKTEIVHENHISLCLKQYMKVWLRHVLQYSSKDRIKCLEDGSNIFEYLQKVLEKKIVNLFSLYTSEFYSYEIDDSTLIGTLKDWIARDIKVPKKELLILSSQRNYDASDDKLVIDLLRKDDLNLYVLKKGLFVNEEVRHTLPKPVKDLFENLRKSFKWNELLQLYQKTIHYILEQIKAMKAIDVALNLYLDYIQHLSRKMRVKEYLLKQEYTKLLIRIECYNNIRKTFECNGKVNSKLYKLLLLEYKIVLSCVRETRSKMVNLMRKIDSARKYLEKLNEKKCQANEIVQELVSLDKELHDACQLLLIKNSKTKLSSFTCAEMFKVVNRIIKKRDILIFGGRKKGKDSVNFDLQGFINGQNTVLLDFEGLIDWMNRCQRCLQQLTKNVNKLETGMIQALVLHSSVEKIRRNSQSSNVKNVEHQESSQLIGENISLRTEFCSMLDMAISQHKENYDNVENPFLK